MSLARIRSARHLGAVLVLAVGLAFLVFAGLESRGNVEAFSFFSMSQVFADFGLVALGFGLTILIGEFDLSVLGVYVLAGAVGVEAGESSPLLGILAALGVGLLAGLINAAAIVWLRMTSIAVTVATAIATIGIAGVIGHGSSVIYENYSPGTTLAEPIAEVLSVRAAICLAIFLAIAAVLGFTRYESQVLACGGDRRASRTVGIRVDRVVFAVFIASGLLAALAGVLYAYTVTTAETTAAWSPVLLGLTAVLLGGVRVEGGRGTVIGMLLGAIAVAALEAGFSILASPLWLSGTVLGGLLAIVAIVTAPGFRDLLRDAWTRAPGLLRRSG